MPVQILDSALGEVRALLLDRDYLVRAVAAGRSRGRNPSVVQAELRPVVLKAGPRLQVVTSDGVRPHTRNVVWGDEASAAVDILLAEPFGNWHVETTTATLQLRVTKKGEAQVHRSAPTGTARPAFRHNRDKLHLIDPDDPLYDLIGGSAAKRRQVDAFLRAIAATLPLTEPSVRNPDGNGVRPQPLRVVDLGCGNAYLTFAAYRYLSQYGLDIELVGVDVREDQRQRNAELAKRLGWTDRVRFVAGTIAEASVSFADPPGSTEGVHVVLALHACDTATDEALARAVGWRAPYVLAAPCCHHDVAAQLRRRPAPPPYYPLTRHAILRERFADVLTDAARAALLRLHGYRVDVVEFVESKHTPRNLLLRARHTGVPPTAAMREEYDDLVQALDVIPRLATLLTHPPPR